MHICNVRSQVFFPGVWVCLRDFILILLFFGSLEREPSLWENTWPWEILRTWESFPGIRLGNQDLWGGEKESTFDTGRRVETGTYHWEGRKPFIQTFEYCPENQRKQILMVKNIVGSRFFDGHQNGAHVPFLDKTWQNHPVMVLLHSGGFGCFDVFGWALFLKMALGQGQTRLEPTRRTYWGNPFR